MQIDNFTWQFKLLFRNRTVKTTVDNMFCCITSGNLAEKQIALAHSIKGVVRVLNREIGKLGGGSIREILKEQSASDFKNDHPFSNDSFDNGSCLEISLGKIPEAEESNSVSLAYSRKMEKWYYIGKSGEDLIFSDVLEFTGEEIRSIVKTLSSAIIILTRVYYTPGGPMDIFVQQINQMKLAESNSIIQLPEKISPKSVFEK